ncbi:S1C family serine protease [Rickettsia typhi]|uniref:Serine protease, HtrA/DegQ/DegS family n=2 Tax=Rickettsia typhi TaxID=785 RepID=Q68XI1_RICTY|nr:S1C family serine protease [Rickettsia typhi]AAU03661.1 serine protease, HtrA/DegQ/DegS family [Rickettsia typhi str. Wilmington]
MILQEVKMKKLPILLKLVFIINLVLMNNIVLASSDTNTAIFEKAKKAIVTIDTRIAVSAYDDTSSWTGTGFINDKNNGYIITNTHVVGGASIGTYFVTFYNGEQTEAKLIYYDIWQDYAILKVESKDIPVSAMQIAFTSELPKLNQKVFVVGNTEAKGFSFHTGYLSDLYHIEGLMPQCTYVINLNTTGGASGSPVLNDKIEAIGVLYGGGKTHSLALHGDYVARTLESLKNNKQPSRKHIGIISELYSLNKAVRYHNFPKDEMYKYINKFPDSRNRVISVKAVLAGSPAQKSLKAGDIIWAVNDQELGGNLALFDREMDNFKGVTIKLTIFRDGKKLEKAVDLYDVNNNKIAKMINFGGAVFFESDDYFSNKSGIPLKALSVASVQAGSSFSSIPTFFNKDYKNVYRLQIFEMKDLALNTLDDLIKFLPAITQQKFITVRFRNYQPYYANFGYNELIASHNDMIADITLDSIDTKPYVLKYNTMSHDWDMENIKLQ